MVAALPAGIAVAAPASQGDVTRLTAGEWTLTGVEASMGSCEQGLQYRFIKASRKVAIRDCISGSWRNRTASWRLERRSPTDLILSLEGVEYQVRFKDGASPRMRLRSRAGPGRAVETTDRTFEPVQD